jgi:hypothetical protein
MPSASEIREQVARESERRSRLAVPALAGGVLYLLSGIIINSTLNGAPSVGLLQGLAPALRGEADPAVSPHAAEVKFTSHHALALIAGSTIAAIAIVALTLVLLLLADATRFRRPNMWSAARPLVLVGGIGVAIVGIGHQVVLAITTHNFATGHDFTNHAVDNALTKGTANVITEYLALLAGLAFAAGMIGVTLNALRVGLVARWMGILGIFTGILIFVPLGGAQLEVVPAFWMVMMGILYAGRWPKSKASDSSASSGDPPAWAAGEARPWPSQARQRADKRPRAGQPALSTAAADVAPAPARPASNGSSRKRRRKRGTRR